MRFLWLCYPPANIIAMFQLQNCLDVNYRFLFSILLITYPSLLDGVDCFKAILSFLTKYLDILLQYFCNTFAIVSPTPPVGHTSPNGRFLSPFLSLLFLKMFLCYVFKRVDFKLLRRYPLIICISLK